MSNQVDGTGESGVPLDDAADSTAADSVEPAEGRRWLPLKPARVRVREDDDEDGLGERLTQQLAHQWALIRAERRADPPPIRAGTSNFDRAQVPWGIDLAAAWAWRFLVILVAVGVLAWIAAYLAVITVPLLIALLVSALGSPLVQAWKRFGIPAGISAIVVVIGGLSAVGALLAFVGQQVVEGFGDLAKQVVVGLGEVRMWLRDGPLNASDSQINDWIKQLQDSITSRTQGDQALSQVTEVGVALGHLLAGFFIVLFATYFFLADGNRIWSWFVRLTPRAARERFDTSGRVAWNSLTQFVRATVIVALVDAIGIMIVAKILGVPFVLAIGVLVFLGAFVPMIGATIAGSVAVLAALVDQGPWTALLMLGGVILVQQLEGHVLQPFLMGRFVSLHPLGIIAAIGCGVLVAGVAGALFAVPAAAALNAVITHLAAYTDPGDDPVEELAEDLSGKEQPDVR